MENKELEIAYFPPFCVEQYKHKHQMSEDETVCFTQAQMAELFSTTKQNISLHTNN